MQTELYSRMQTEQYLKYFRIYVHMQTELFQDCFS